MTMNENRISSTQNPKIKHLQLLRQKSSERRNTGMFVVEGKRELQHCIDAGLNISSVFICMELYGNEYPTICNKTLEVSREIYEKIA